MAESDWKVVGNIKNVNKQPQYFIANPEYIPEPEYDSWPALIGKSALKGVMALGDVPRLAAEGVEGAVNYGRRFKRLKSKPSDYMEGQNVIVFETDPNAPQTDYASHVPASEDVRKGIKNYMGIDLEPHPETAEQRIASHGIEFASPSGLLGVFMKAPNLIAKGLNARKAATSGAAIGTTSGALQEGGVNPLAADIGAAIVNPAPKNIFNAFKKTKENLPKIPIKVMGLGPKSINLEAARAARDLGIDLPAAALTDSKITNLLDQLVGKTPYFGNKLGNKYSKAQEQTKNVLENIYEAIGPKRTPEIEAKIEALYNKRTRELPKGASIKPFNVDQAIKDIKIDTAVLSLDEHNLLKNLNEIKKTIRPKPKTEEVKKPKKVSALTDTKQKILEAITDMKIDTAVLSSAEKKWLDDINEIQANIKPKPKKGKETEKLKAEISEEKGIEKTSAEHPLKPINVSTLTGTKTSLNNIIQWPKDEGVKNQLRKVQYATARDIEKYGETNPVWYKKHKEADELYGKVARRETVENILGGSINPSTSDISYAALSKKINGRHQQKALQKLLRTPQDITTYNKIQKLGEVARAMAIKNRNIPNPSGTAPTAAVIGYLGNLHTPETLAAVIGTSAATKLLTDKKFIDLAIKYAENPNKKGYLNSLDINRRIKELTGVSALVLSRELERANKEKNELR